MGCSRGFSFITHKGIFSKKQTFKPVLRNSLPVFYQITVCQRSKADQLPFLRISLLPNVSISHTNEKMSRLNLPNAQKVCKIRCKPEKKYKKPKKELGSPERNTKRPKRSSESPEKQKKRHPLLSAGDGAFPIIPYAICEISFAVLPMRTP